MVVGLLLALAVLTAPLVAAPNAAAKTVNGCKLKPNARCAGKNLNWNLEFHGNLTKANFRNAKLRGADLRMANLANADLRGVDLTSAALAGAKLQGARLNGATLTMASLKGANLSGANLTLVSGENSGFYGVTMRNAVLRNANLNNANLYGADLSGTDLSGSNQPPPPPPFSNEKAKLTTNLENANLFGATLSGTNLTNANLENANLYGVVTQPKPANFSGALLYSAILDSGIYNGSNFTRAFMHASSIQRTAMVEVNFTDASLGSVVMISSLFEGANFTGAIFPGAVWINVTCPAGGPPQSTPCVA